VQEGGYEYRGRWEKGAPAAVATLLQCFGELPDTALQRDLNEQYEASAKSAAAPPPPASADAAASAPLASARPINVTAGERIPAFHICLTQAVHAAAAAPDAAAAPAADAAAAAPVPQPQRLGLVTQESGRKIQVRIVVPTVADETEPVPPVWLCACISAAGGPAEKCAGAENASCAQNAAPTCEAQRATFEGCASFEDLIVRSDAPGDLSVVLEVRALLALPSEHARAELLPPVLQLPMLINAGPASAANPRKRAAAAPAKKK
jgi:hypothetical protein